VVTMFNKWAPLTYSLRGCGWFAIAHFLVCVLGCFFGFGWFLVAVGCGVGGFCVTSMLVLLVVGVMHVSVSWFWVMESFSTRFDRNT
jgi:hypothetical protein